MQSGLGKENSNLYILCCRYERERDRLYRDSDRAHRADVPRSRQTNAQYGFLNRMKRHILISLKKSVAYIGGLVYNILHGRLRLCFSIGVDALKIKITAVLAAAVAAVFAAAPAAFAYADTAAGACVVNAVTGEIVFERDSGTRLPMASTTKIMTAAVALKYGNLSDVIEVSATAAGVEGSSMYLECGEKITLENLLYGLMLLSGNDAAVAIAEHIGGGVDGFVELMNKTASELGLSHTHFDNPNGLPSDTHYTTALELAKITRYAMSMPEFVQIVSTKSKTIPWEGKGYDRSMTNHNKLLGSLEGCIGVKTGFTKAAGRCLVSAVNRNDMTLICVTLNDPNDWADHASLQNSMFQKYSQNVLTSTEMIIDKISVAGGMLGYAGVSPNKTYTFPVCENDSVSVDTNVDSENMKFPIKSGDVVGTGTVTVNGENYGNFELLANSDIDLARPSKGSFWNDMKNDIVYVFQYWLSMFR